MLPATFWRREPSLRLLKRLITANTKHSARRCAFQKDVSSAHCYQIANNDNSHQSRSLSSQDSGLLTYAFCENYTHMHPMNCSKRSRRSSAVRSEIGLLCVTYGPYGYAAVIRCTLRLVVDDGKWPVDSSWEAAGRREGDKCYLWASGTYRDCELMNCGIEIYVLNIGKEQRIIC